MSENITKNTTNCGIFFDDNKWYIGKIKNNKLIKKNTDTLFDKILELISLDWIADQGIYLRKQLKDRVRVLT